MAANMTNNALLPKELMELQLGQIDLLMAMYASDDAVSINDTYLQLLESLRSWCESDEESQPNSPESSISMVLNLALSDEDDSPSPSEDSLQLDLLFPLVQPQEDATEEAPVDPPKAKIRVRQSGWMSKAEAARLTEEIPDEDLLTAIDHVKEAAAQQLSQSQQVDAKPSLYDADAPVVRIWFYFPSISTRSKRDDIVNYAPTYGLTGFLLAGKPGVLCLEGGSQAIDDYMKFIKTESWSDIPSQHKKVSERYREPNVKRKFQDMKEITDEFGERRGVRQNRNDMKALETWLNNNGVGEAFAKVLI